MVKKKVMKRAKKTYSTLQKLDSFVRSLQEFYPNDPSCPGIIISYLPGLQQYYASAVRFSAMYGKNSYSIFNIKANTLEECYIQLMEIWKNKIKPSKNATEEFLKFI